jgi:hypothetical protein
MRLNEYLKHLLVHSGLSGIGIDDHHDQPEHIPAENTTLSVSPLPGGPGVWDIPVPLEASVVLFSFRSMHDVEMGSAKAGVTGVATRSQLQASSVSIGGDGTLTTASKVTFYCKPAAALNLSDKIFSAAGDFITLSDAYLYLTSPTTRVLRTQWTNYGASYLTLNARGHVAVIG